jgi:hypothetical protein
VERATCLVRCDAATFMMPGRDAETSPVPALLHMLKIFLRRSVGARGPRCLWSNWSCRVRSRLGRSLGTWASKWRWQWRRVHDGGLQTAIVSIIARCVPSTSVVGVVAHAFVHV